MIKPELTILIVSDSNFKNLCDDPTSYVEKLYGILNNRYKVPIKIITVSGRYGLSAIDSNIETLDVEDRNKTLFTQTIENHAAVFDELQIISLSNIVDPFIEGVADAMSALQKNITRYSYKRK